MRASCFARSWTSGEPREEGRVRVEERVLRPAPGTERRREGRGLQRVRVLRAAGRHLRPPACFGGGSV